MPLVYLGAATEKPPADIKKVDFRSGEGAFDWNLVAVEVEANENPDPDAPNPNYVDNIRVIVTLGYEKESGDGFTFYQAEATIVTLERGDSKRVGFWLPFDIVERDDLPQEPRYWIVELEVNGKKLDLLSNSASFSSKFTSRQSVEGFLAQASSQLSATEGIFVPGYLSPNPPIDGREPPAFIRRDAR